MEDVQGSRKSNKEAGRRGHRVWRNGPLHSGASSKASEFPHRSESSETALPSWACRYSESLPSLFRVPAKSLQGKDARELTG